MTIDEMCEYAKEHGYDSLRFMFSNLSGETVTLRWLDAYMGLFIIEKFKDMEETGFVTVSQWKKLWGNTFSFSPIKEDQNDK